jgi:hypothetical protein
MSSQKFICGYYNNFKIIIDLFCDRDPVVGVISIDQSLFKSDYLTDYTLCIKKLIKI